MKLFRAGRPAKRGKEWMAVGDGSKQGMKFPCYWISLLDPLGLHAAAIIARRTNAGRDIFRGAETKLETNKRQGRALHEIEGCRIR